MQENSKITTGNDLIMWLEGYLSAAIGQSHITPQQIKTICDKLKQVRDQLPVAQLTYLPKQNPTITIDDVASVDYTKTTLLNC